ncbi:MAG: NUDIX hydrolase [Candidatus Caenarcaniphilales bacterium]|nr:NUDIX hydrolase [Candidatus Caenarcaniphilales bacterium]
MHNLTDLTEKQISRRSIHKGSVVETVVDEIILPNGKSAKREVILHAGGIVIVPITKEGHFVLVEQYRYPIETLLLEFPAGRLNPGEDPLKAAYRELAEETGYRAASIEPLGFIYTAPGFCSEKLYMYVAKGLEEGEQNPDEDEFVKPVLMSKEELAQKIKNFEIHDAKTLAAWSLVGGQ